MRLAAVEIPMPSQGQVLWLGVKRLGGTSHFFCFVLRLLMSDISGNDFWDAELNRETSDNCDSFQTAVRQGGFDLVSRAEIIHLRASRVTSVNV